MAVWFRPPQTKTAVYGPSTRPCGQRTKIWAQTVHLMDKFGRWTKIIILKWTSGRIFDHGPFTSWTESDDRLTFWGGRLDGFGRWMMKISTRWTEVDEWTGWRTIHYFLWRLYSINGWGWGRILERYWDQYIQMTEVTITMYGNTIKWLSAYSRMLNRTIRYTCKWLKDGAVGQEGAINDRLKSHLSHYSLRIISNTVFLVWFYSWWFCGIHFP